MRKYTVFMIVCAIGGLALVSGCRRGPDETLLVRRPGQEKRAPQAYSKEIGAEQEEYVYHKPVRKKNIIPEFKKAVKDLTEEELEKAQAFSLRIDDQERVIKYVEQLMLVSADANKLEKLSLELADLYFNTGDYEKAEKGYEAYVNKYPGNAHNEYARYQHILCSFYLTYTADRDQTKTHDTLALIRAYYENPDLYTAYVEQVKTIELGCRQKLYEHECNILQTYLNLGHYTAAQERVAYIKEECVPTVKNEYQILAFEYEIAKKTKNETMLTQVAQALAAQYPQSPLVLAYNNESPKRDNTQRF
jgi:outer membrane assembly lipoprotein YfiO